MTSPPPASDLEWRVGSAAIPALAIVLLTWALTVDFPKVTNGGFFSDGATYYSLAHSLAADWDFQFRREDLTRVWREYPGGPEGIFLKRGRDIEGLDWSSSFPFIALKTSPDPDASRLFYGKSFIYPLFAAPFVWLFGTNGFLVLHALLMTMCFACAYAFLVARSTPLAAVVFALAFLFASVAPVYMAYLTPDFFNLALVCVTFFFWTYKEVVVESPTACLGKFRRTWAMGVRSDLVAAVVLGIATFSKPTHVLLMAPMLALFLARRQWMRGLLVGAVFALVTVGFFGWNLAISGEWNYQGGEDRSTFYSADPDGPAGPRVGGFPFLTPEATFDTTGLPRETNRVPVEVLITTDAVGAVFRNNLVYFFFGRYAGFVPYFFPGAVAIVLFLLRARQRPLWQWLVLGAGLGSAVFFILYMPFTYSGGGGPVGNRYFLGVYPVFLYVMPPLARLRSGLVSLAIGGLFTAQLVLNPFFASVRTGEHAKRGVFRWLPVELTLLNDLPVNLNPSRSKQPLGGVPPVAAYFIDDNAYPREGDRFWVRGESRTEIMLRAPIEQTTVPDAPAHSFRIAKLDVELESGAVPDRVTIQTGAETQVVERPAHDRRTISLAMPSGLPYKPFPDLPNNFVYLISIESESGFIPLFSGGGRDARFLGVFVRLVPQYE